VTYRKRNPPVGSRPGTLAIPPGSPPPRFHVLAYGPEHFEEHDLKDPRRLRRLLDQRTEGPVWVHVEGLGDEAKLRAVGRLFDLHPVTLEDATNVPARARYEDHADQLVLVARLPGMREDGRLDVPQVCLVLEKDVLLTFEEHRHGFLDPVRARIRESGGSIRSAGADYLAYAVVDTLVDHYYPVAEALYRELEDLEEEIMERPAGHVMPRLHRIRRDLSVIRRIGRPQREALQGLLRGHSPLVSEEVRVFLRDTVHHLHQILELVDASWEMAAGLTEMHLSSLSQRTNDIMKMLTLVGSIFIPLTFIAGVYGMNFEFMPELEHRWAYPAVLTAMAVVAVAMLAYFRHRGWIGGGSGRRRGESVEEDGPPDDPAGGRP
jgi:magnesium transporter